MSTHLKDRHPTWEVTMPDKDRQKLLSKITITHNEECRLKVPETARTTEAEVVAESVTAGQKRGPPRSLPGTPQRSRVLVTSPHRATTVARAQDVRSSSVDDVFT
ncbi:hypothetical protein B0H10DRAFT_1960217 [Mycena sp. CBHHK59/15]|nr:hypothetical protein B0H10DRAFT_1960217 [Mycena sp. CBHHK59/15]